MGGDLEDSDSMDALFKSISWRLMPILFAGYVIAYIDRVNIGFAKLQMLNDLQFSAAVYGLGAGIFFAGFTLMELPSNLILYRVGARAWLARIMVTWGVISVLMLFVRTPLSFYVLRFLLGAAEAGFLPGVIYYLTLWYPADRRGRIFSIFTSGSAVGGVLVGPLSGWTMTYFNGTGGLRGWQWLFALQGAAAVLVGVLLFWLLSDSPKHAKWLRPEDQARLSKRLAATAEGEARHSSLASAFLDSRVWLLGLVLGMTNLGVYVGVFWLPTMIRDAGMTSYEAIGWISSLSYVAAAVAMLALGRSSDHFGDRRWHVATTLMVAALALAASAAFAQAPLVAAAGVMIATPLFIGVTPLLWVHASSFISGQAAAAGFALINICAGVAAFLAPYLMGLAQARLGDTHLVLFGVAGCAVIAAVALLTAPALSPVHSPPSKPA